METEPPPEKLLPDLESHLGYWLRRISNAVSGEFSRTLQGKQSSVAEWVVLCELHKRNQAAPAELAAASGLTRGAVSKIIDKLEAKGWIQIKERQDDSRFRSLSLTRAGLRILPVLAGIADRNDERFFACLTSQEKDVLRTLLVKIAEANHIHEVPTS